ncbi:GNAT family N-acetyltransferase [Glaciecola siphonariae]|uniref:GNAT family N-acetyltransferase n=1 Tax=Glaciecola siphonariae TaxID=521012 RepID=A0ABV9M0T4_9ALTE
MDKNTVSINTQDEFDNIELVFSMSAHYEHLLTWLPKGEAFVRWAGPSLDYPEDAASFEASLVVGNYQSYTLINASGDTPEILGFGQIQIWSSRAHLGRLIIAPQYRGRGLSYILVNLLIEKAAAQHNITSVSLFVYKDNLPAVTSYQNLGFVPSAYPKEVTFVEGCSFMTLDY